MIARKVLSRFFFQKSANGCIWYNLRQESDPVYGMICSAIVCALVKMQNIPMCRCGSDDRCFQRTERCHRTENWC